MKDSILAKLSWNFASKYRITLMIWLLVLVFGLLSYTTLLKREGFPPVNLPIAAVQGTYFVDNPEVIDRDVTQPIAAAVESVESVDTYEASSGQNFYNVLVTFTEETDAADGAREVEAAIKDQVKLPQGAENTVSAIDPTKFDNTYNLLLAVYAEQDSDYKALAEKADLVTEELGGVSEIDTAETVPVLETVTNPDGSRAERQTVINKIALRQDGRTVFYPAVNVGVVRANGVDDIQLSEAVQQTLDDLKSRQELNGTKTQITADLATNIDQQIGSLEDSLITGLLAVVAVVLLLISWRAALVIALFIPTVLAITFLGLNMLGYTLNTITLFATILALALFVDDATIIVEAIDAHRKEKRSHKEIIKTAITRVGLASVAGTLTTMLVFTPMLFVTGIIGSFIRLLPITVILALAASLTTALLLIPFMTRPLVLNTKRAGRLLDRLSLMGVERRLAGFFSRLPLLNRDNRKVGRRVTILMVGISFLAIFAAGQLAGKLPLEIFPASKDGDFLQATVEFAPGTTIAQAEAITDKLDERISRTVGGNLDHVTYVTADERQAMIEIGLTPYTKREPTSHQILADLEASGDRLDSADIKFSFGDVGPGADDFPFQMRVYADDEATLQAAATDLAGFIKTQKLSASGKTISVAEVTTDIDDDTIKHTENGRYATVRARFSDEGLNSAAVILMEEKVTAAFTEARLAGLGLGRDALDFDVSQESENAESFSAMGIGLLVAVAGMYLLLVLLFNSFSQPLLILLALPFSLFGVFFGLTVTDNALSFFVMLGLLGLFGIAVNNSILLTQYANQEREAGADRHTAISNAIRHRFRPLVATTLISVFALLPLALQDPFWQSLAYTLIFGLLSSTTLIILSFPYFYLGVERLRDWKNRRFPGLR